MNWHILAIAAGGAVGAVLRFWVSSGTYALLGREFPYGTLAVNVVGSLLMGFLAIILVERVAQTEWRSAILIGGLGAFTTFSTFSIETQQLILADQYTKAALNALLSVVLCVSATWFGMLLAKASI